MSDRMDSKHCIPGLQQPAVGGAIYLPPETAMNFSTTDGGHVIAHPHATRTRDSDAALQTRTDALKKLAEEIKTMAVSDNKKVNGTIELARVMDELKAWIDGSETRNALQLHFQTPAISKSLTGLEDVLSSAKPVLTSLLATRWYRNTKFEAAIRTLLSDIAAARQRLTAAVEPHTAAHAKSKKPPPGSHAHSALPFVVDLVRGDELFAMAEREWFSAAGSASGAAANQSRDRAYAHYLESAEVCGYARSMVKLARMLLDGYTPPIAQPASAPAAVASVAGNGAPAAAAAVVPPPIAQALSWLERASTLHDADAMHLLASMLDGGGSGFGSAGVDTKSVVTPDPARAIHLYERSARAGNLDAACAAGEFREREAKRNGSGLDAALEWYRRAAMAGSARAQNCLGHALFNSPPANNSVSAASAGAAPAATTDNLTAAMKWFTLAASSGWIPAHFNLAVCYESSQQPNVPLAIQHYEIAAAARHTGAEANLGYLYLCQRRIPEATEMLRRAAEKNSHDGLYYLGQLYHHLSSSGGGASSLDSQKAAFLYYCRAAESGHVYACREVANCFYSGFGTSIDRARAFEWYSAGAKSHEPACMNSLGLMWENGEAPLAAVTAAAATNATEQAVYWYERAIAAGCGDAATNLALLINRQPKAANAASAEAADEKKSISYPVSADELFCRAASLGSLPAKLLLAARERQKWWAQQIERAAQPHAPPLALQVQRESGGWLPSSVWRTSDAVHQPFVVTTQPPAPAPQPLLVSDEKRAPEAATNAAGSDDDDDASDGEFNPPPAAVAAGGAAVDIDSCDVESLVPYPNRFHPSHPQPQPQPSNPLLPLPVPSSNPVVAASSLVSPQTPLMVVPTPAASAIAVSVPPPQPQPQPAAPVPTAVVFSSVSTARVISTEPAVGPQSPLPPLPQSPPTAVDATVQPPRSPAESTHSSTSSGPFDSDEFVRSQPINPYQRPNQIIF